MQIPKSFTTVTLLSKTIAIMLFVSLPFTGFYFGRQYGLNQTTIDSVAIIPGAPTAVPTIQSTASSWVKPVSTDTAIPIIKNGLLNWYSLSKKQLTPTEYKSSWGGGAMGMGEDKPLSSPDGKYIVFINQADKNRLYLLASGSSQARKVTDYSVLYLNSWSADSTKILFYSQVDNIDIRKVPEGMGGPVTWETVEDFTKNTAPGFHVFNINDGKDTFLYPLLTADKFMDSSRVVVETKDSATSRNTRLVLFDVNTFVADYATVGYPIVSFSGQKSFSANGEYWARSVDDGSTSTGVRIVYSKFPNEKGDVVDSAAWAFIQRPILNPNGKYLAYSKKGDQIKTGKFAGQYPDKTVIWDTNLKKTIKEIDGWPEYWANENTILVGNAEYGNNFTSFTSLTLLNVDTQQTDSIPML